MIINFATSTIQATWWWWTGHFIWNILNWNMTFGYERSDYYTAIEKQYISKNNTKSANAFNWLFQQIIFSKTFSSKKNERIAIMTLNADLVLFTRSAYPSFLAYPAVDSKLLRGPLYSHKDNYITANDLQYCKMQVHRMCPDKDQCIYCLYKRDLMDIPYLKHTLDGIQCKGPHNILGYIDKHPLHYVLRKSRWYHKVDHDRVRLEHLSFRTYNNWITNEIFVSRSELAYHTKIFRWNQWIETLEIDKLDSNKSSENL